MHRPRVRYSHHPLGMEAHTYHEAGGQVLVRGLRADCRSAVLSPDTSCESAMLLKVCLKLTRVYPGCIRESPGLRAIAEHLGPLTVEVNQLLRGGLAFCGVRAQQRR